MSYSVKLAESEDIDKLIQLRLDFSDANNGPHPETYELRKANLKSYFERHLNRDCYAAIVEQDGKAVSTGILGVYENPPKRALCKHSQRLDISGIPQAGLRGPCYGNAEAEGKGKRRCVYRAFRNADGQAAL